MDQAFANYSAARASHSLSDSGRTVQRWSSRSTKPSGGWQGGPAPLNSQSEADFDWVDDEGRYHGHFMSQFFNFTSHVPAFSVPSGFTGNGLPTAVQIVGRRHDDNMVLRIGQALETALGWPAHRPPL